MTLILEKTPAYMSRKKRQQQRRSERYGEWVAAMNDLDLVAVRDSAPWGPFVKAPQIRTLNSARDFILWMAESYGRDGNSLRASTRSMAKRYGSDQHSVMDYLSIAVDLEWIDVCQEARQSEDPRERRPAHHQIRRWWSDKQRTLMQEGFIPTADELLRQIEERLASPAMDAHWNDLLDEPFTEGDPADVPF